MSTRMGHKSMNRAEQNKTTTLKTVERLTAEDLEALAEEATRMGLSLACLIGALEDDSPILWCDEEKRDQS